MTPHAALSFTLTAQGHANVQASHSSTFEVTTEAHLTRRGDCIIGVRASHSAKTLNPLLGDALRQPQRQIHTVLKVGAITDTIQGWGAPTLLLTAPTSLVWRTSTHIDGRTVAIRCDKAAQDLDRRLVALLQKPTTCLQVQLILV